MDDATMSSADFCFVHAADLHLGGRRWLSRMPESAEMRHAVREADRSAFRRLVQLCLDERARFLILAGDVFDGWCRDHHVGYELCADLSRLREAHCDVVVTLGNHDVRSPVAGPLLLPQHAFVLGLTGPETRLFERAGVAFHSWSAPNIGRDDDVALHYPAPLSGLFNVGLLHTSAEGRRGHENYAPCSRLSLRRRGYDYWALGHVHAREIVHREPWIVFPGNLQARGFRELGPKGASLVRVKDGRVEGVDHRPLDVLRFANVVTDTQGARNFDDVLELGARALLESQSQSDGRALVARLVFQGHAGARAVLGVSPHLRAEALRRLTAKLEPARFWLDEAWLEFDEREAALPLVLAA